MKFKALGRSGLLVSELCLGTMIFGEDSSRSTPPDEAERIIAAYLEAGGNHIDTANVYAAGRSEEIVGQALRGKREQVVLATKVRFAMGSGPNDQGLSRYHISRSVEDSLRRLADDALLRERMGCRAREIVEQEYSLERWAPAGRQRVQGGGQNRSAQIARRAGRPVVASAVGGIPEIVEDGVTGLLVEPGDPRRVADAVLALLDRQDLRVRMGASARARVADLFRWPVHVKALLDLYDRVTARAPALTSPGARS